MHSPGQPTRPGCAPSACAACAPRACALAAALAPRAPQQRVSAVHLSRACCVPRVPQRQPARLAPLPSAVSLMQGLYCNTALPISLSYSQYSELYCDTLFLPGQPPLCHNTLYCIVIHSASTKPSTSCNRPIVLQYHFFLTQPTLLAFESRYTHSLAIQLGSSPFPICTKNVFFFRSFFFISSSWKNNKKKYIYTLYIYIYIYFFHNNQVNS